MSWLLDQATAGATALKSTFGGGRSPTLASLDGFGFLPALPVAVWTGIVAGVATMAYFIADAVKFSVGQETKRAAIAQQAALLQSGSITPEQYNVSVSELSSQPTGDSLTTTIKWVAVVGAVFLIAPEILKLIRSRS